MQVGTIMLTTEEQQLREAVVLDVLAIKDNAAFAVNADRVVDLTQRLLARGAVPEHRLRYLKDPDYNPGGRKASRLDAFKRHGLSGEAVMRHPHFLPYLAYFLEGAALPSTAINAFQREVQACGLVTSGDIIPLGNYARQLTGTHGLVPGQACEEFFKLALDCGLSASTASSIREAVKSVR